MLHNKIISFTFATVWNEFLPISKLIHLTNYTTEIFLNKLYNHCVQAYSTYFIKFVNYFNSKLFSVTPFLYLYVLLQNVILQQFTVNLKYKKNSFFTSSIFLSWKKKKQIEIVHTSNSRWKYFISLLVK